MRGELSDEAGVIGLADHDRFAIAGLADNHELV
jgi:hypothetical protein